MTCFPDVNVWISLVVPEHIHRAAAADWYNNSSCDVMVFSRVTQAGFLRLLTNPNVMGKQVESVAEAWETFDGLCRSDGVVFANEPADTERIWRSYNPAPGTGSSFWTDAYRAAFAERTGFTLVTFDKGFKKYRTIPVRILG